MNIQTQNQSNSIKLFNEEKFIGVDLHVHTPASSCYKGNKKDSEYIEILNRFIDKNIKVIAITDHNTLKGYEKIQQLKKDMEDRIKLLADYLDDSDEIRKKYNTLVEQMEKLKEILVLPGVEFETKECIHLLFIGNPESNLDNLQEFLKDAGYEDDIQGEEEANIICKYDIEESMQVASNLGLLVIAAHVDGDKGVYNSFPKGNKFRASVFKSNSLNAISYNNPITCEKIKSIMKDPKYYRSSPISYIQSSDYHGEPEKLGTKISFMYMEELTFESLCNAFKDPESCISPTQHPKYNNVINKILDEDNALTLQSISTNEDNLFLAQFMCALLNQGYGTVVVGVQINPSKVLIGVEQNIEQWLSILRDISNKLYPSHKYSVTIFPYGDKNILSVRVIGNPNTVYSLNNEEMYVLEGKSAKKACIKDLVESVENKILKSIQSYQSIHTKRVEVLVNEINKLKISMSDTSKQFSVIHKIDKNSSLLKDLLEVRIVNYQELMVSINDEPYNGELVGDVFYACADSPRLESSYLRYTCPITSKYRATDIDIEKQMGNTLILAPGGAIYYIDKIDGEWAILPYEGNYPIPLLKVQDNLKDKLSNLSVVAWLKSTAFLFYCHVTQGDINIYRAAIFKQIPMPALKIFSHGNDIDKLVLCIIDKEKNFLELINKDNDLSEKELSEIARNHNSEIEKLSCEIDNLIYKSLKITDEEVEVITKYLDENKIYTFQSIDLGQV